MTRSREEIIEFLKDAVYDCEHTKWVDNTATTREEGFKVMGENLRNVLEFVEGESDEQDEEEHY